MEEEQMTRTTSVTLFALLTLAAITVTVVFADSANFDERRTGAKCAGTNLEVNFRETGLGNTPSVNYLVTANAANKRDVNGPVSAPGNFPSGKNGSVVGNITLNPPSAGDFSCPTGQDLVLLSATYSQVTITDTDHNVSFTLPGTFSCP
jgi:hypothetical protein